MITLDQLLGKYSESIVPIDHYHNLQTLRDRVNKLFINFKLSVTSGYRSIEDHLRIYAQKGITDQKKIPMKSKHLSGEACDLLDVNGELKEFVRNNPHLIEECGLWFESFSCTGSWLHAQSVPPKSGIRFFYP